MGDTTGISWTDHTFNPWWGCARVSPGCMNCYAETFARRYGHELWHRQGPRRMLSERVWGRPAIWNRDAEAAGVPAKVFCASMADVFEDHPQVAGPRARLWDVTAATPWLRWQLLTKRPENIAGMAPWTADWPANIWLGTSAEDQRRADERLPELVRHRALLFVSVEPLLGPVDLAPWLDRLSWVIVGGESGPRHRDMDPAWLAGVVSQCQAAGVPLWVKQDSGPHSGMQGRIGADAWALRQFPAGGRRAA